MEKAIALATDVQQRRAVHEALVQARDTCALFDTRTNVRALERAYGMMLDLRGAGRAPQHLVLARAPG